MPLTFHHHSMHRCIRRPRCIRSDLIVRNVDRPLGERCVFFYKRIEANCV
ncbi:hypothetical protein V6Z12_D08G079100 [Gossypium hirsutum]